MATPRPSALSTPSKALCNAPSDTSLDKWIVKALQSYLRVRGLTYSRMKKSELIVVASLAEIALFIIHCHANIVHNIIT